MEWLAAAVVLVLGFSWRSARERAARLEALLAAHGIDPASPIPSQGEAAARAVVAERLGYSDEEADDVLQQT